MDALKDSQIFDFADTGRGVHLGWSEFVTTNLTDETRRLWHVYGHFHSNPDPDYPPQKIAEILAELNASFRKSPLQTSLSELLERKNKLENELNSEKNPIGAAESMGFKNIRRKRFKEGLG